MLIFFGLTFTKTQIFGPLYLHDLVLIIFLVYSITVRPLKTLKFPTILVFIFISIIYLLYSLFFLQLSTELKTMSLRQYMMYFYLIAAYIYYNQYIKNSDLTPLIIFLYRIGVVSIILEVLFLFYLIIYDFNNFSFFEGYNYYSHAVMFGLINFGAYALVFKQGVYKWLLFSTALLLSTFLGHASLFLAVFSLLLLYILIRVNLKAKITAISLGVLSIWFLTFLPQFQDANASWRLLFWSEINKIIFLNNYGLLGEGFGVPYVSIDFAFELLNKIGAHGFLDQSRHLERWVSPPHNSFFTICFHTGFISLVLLLTPIKNIVKYFFIDSSKTQPDKNKVFLLLLLFSYMVWVSFNVVLELPHSAMLFWLVFFVSIEYFNSNRYLIK
jgi:hypothetical protein